MTMIFLSADTEQNKLYDLFSLEGAHSASTFLSSGISSTSFSRKKSSPHSEFDFDFDSSVDLYSVHLAITRTLLPRTFLFFLPRWSGARARARSARFAFLFLWLLCVRSWPFRWFFAVSRILFVLRINLFFIRFFLFYFLLFFLGFLFEDLQQGSRDVRALWGDIHKS